MKKNRIAALVVGGFLLVGGAALSQASDRDQCEHRVHKAEQNLNQAIHKHGEHSRQAEQKRRELEQARAQCRDDRHDDNHDHDNDHRH